MLSEYAVDPAAIGADWRTFKDLIDRFGADKGRLISRLPRKWQKMVKKAAENARVSDVDFKRIIELLSDSKRKVVNFNRTYENDADWIDNALREHKVIPFKAIICDDGSATCTEAMQPEECTDGHPLFGAAASLSVPKTADGIANALYPIVEVSKKIDIVDRYFDLRPEKGYLDPLTSLLAQLTASSKQQKVIRIHFGYHHSRPSAQDLAEDKSTQIGNLLPTGYCLELYAWSMKDNGEQFHDRFVLTDLGGIMIGAGLSTLPSAPSVNVGLLEFNHAQELREKFADGSNTYKREGPAVRIRDNGAIELF